MSVLVHAEPVRRSAADWIARIALEPFGFDGQWEQVWLRRREGDLAELCCIPLLAYGVALGDVVRLSGDGSTVLGVVERSGRHVFRALLTVERTEEVAEIRAEIEAMCARAGLLLEWTDGRFVGIDIPPDADVSGLAGLVEARRLEWEWSSTLPFEAPRLRRWWRRR
ncbi:DUF4265 domain-containing protein [Kribbella antibiotica]|uniref:DUF4265 domain-containing protein n=1 Tax=Kribbella antibiotica TaxID=190195 RepID=A0A4R4Y9Y8_9ACTN|nr:DUF4265 domain-containing protein [Kribbella antibiotica]TDD41315.1 DUF4265 domain-containing protein [Kribbella antibiotica]